MQEFLGIWVLWDTWVALATLCALEIVLGIDNLVFIAILTENVKPAQRPLARRLGLGVALLTRLGLLFGISALMALQEPFFSILGRAFSGRDLILLVGGLFLIAKATFEIHSKMQPPRAGSAHGPRKKVRSFLAVVVQIGLIDIVFSLDSVITAVGMVSEVSIMVVAILITVAVMLLFANPVSEFIERHPTFKVLALSFLLMIGALLVVEGSGGHIDKGYIYFAMGFSLLVETVNLRVRKWSDRKG